MAGGWTIGVDTGGTFTDAMAVHADGRIALAKVPSTPDDPSRGLIAGVRELLAGGIDPAEVEQVFHGTTVATNAMLTGRRGRVVLAATEGFADLMAFRDGTRPVLYDLRQRRPDPIVAEEDRIEVGERLSSLGEVVTPLTDAEVDRVVAEVARRKPQAVAVAFLFSYVDDRHEQVLAEAIRSRLPGVPVTTSAEVAREFREYPRTATAVVNASLRPIVGHYVAEAERGVSELGISAPFLVMQSNGGCVPAARAEAEAHRLLLSGPTAGVAGAVALAERRGIDGIISFDMGGTSIDVCLVQGRTPPTTSRQRVEDHPILVPSVDIVTAGAGGGSIARVDRAGRLRVGPESAGADPGPAAYGRGGTEPTLTDAAVVTGVLGHSPLAGRLTLDRDLAEQAVARIAEPLGLDVMQAAEGIIAVATAHSVGALRRVSVERGLDPRGFSLLAFGGAGPLLAGRLVEELGLAAAIVPPHPGLFSAAGLMAASLRLDDAQTVLRPLDPVLADELLAWMRSARERLIEQLVDDGIPRSRTRIVASADCRYEGQGFELDLPLPNLSRAAILGLPRAFAERHRTMYGHADPRDSVEVVTVRIAAFGDLRRSDPAMPPRGGREPVLEAMVGKRRALVHGARAPRIVPVYRREALKARNTLAGPAIVEQMDSTTVIGVGQRGSVDDEGNLWIRRAR